MVAHPHSTPSLFSSLCDMLNQFHLLYKLADKIDWAKFDTAFAPLYCQNILLSDKSFFAVKNKAEILQEDFSLFCYFACCKKTLVTWAKVHILPYSRSIVRS